MARGDKLKLTFLLGLWLAVFVPVWPDLVRAWFDDSDNSHALLVPFLALFFAWQKRGDLQRTRIDGSAWGGLLLVASLVVYVVSYAGGIAFTARIAVVSTLFGLIIFCLGNGFARQLAFPVGLLVFMVPVPTSLVSTVSMPLQLLATRISATLIEYCRIPVYREGNMLYFVQTQLEVAEACSGVRSIMALTMLSVIFCHWAEKGWWRKALLLGAAIPIAMLVNMIRVTGTGILAHFYGGDIARGFLHEMSGVIVFMLGFVLLAGLFSVTNRKSADV